MRVYTFPTVQDQVHQAVKLWNDGLTRKQVGTIIGKSPALVSMYLKSAGVNMRERRYAKYGLDTHFFDKVDTHVKAYWLGFVLADGHIPKGGRALVTELQARDRPHLEAFARDVSFTGPVRDTVHRHVRKGKPETHGAVRLDLCSQEMTSALRARGWDGFKERGELPIAESVRKNLLPSLLRGLFDGDGSRTLYKGQLFFSFTNRHRRVAEWYQDQLVLKLGLARVTVQPARRRCAWTFRYGGNIQVRGILDWLNSTPGPRLDRKHGP